MDDATRVAIERWLIKAERDLVTAKTMLAIEPPVTDVVCFHSQQCAEKALKAFLVFGNVHVEKTHYLRRLVELCGAIDPAFFPVQEMATGLSEYVTDRYPDNWREIPIDEAKQALRDSKKILDLVRERLPTPLGF